MKLEIAVVMSAVAITAAACDDDDGDVTTADSAYVNSTAAAANYDAAAMYAATDPLTDPFYLAKRAGSAATASSSDTEDAANAAASGAGHYFTPKDCVDASASGSEVTYKLDSCSGPFGEKDVNGTIHLSFLAPQVSEQDGGTSDGGGVSAKELAFTLSSDDLTINGSPAKLASSGMYTRSSSGKKQVMLSSMSSFTVDGQMVTNNVDTTINWMAGSQCIDLDSTGKVATGGQNFDLDIENFQRCATDCPKSGTVRLSGPRTITLTLDGTNQPSYVDSNGSNGAIQLDCES